jgi:hypothetical protein
MAQGRLTLSFWDYDKETSTVTVPSLEIDETTLVAQNALMAAFFLAVGDMSLGQIYKDVRVFEESQVSGTPPSATAAQRESKWLVRMTEADTYRKLTMEIPCADTALLDADNRGAADPANADVIAFVSALEDLYLSDRDKAITVDEIIFVGRNL